MELKEFGLVCVEITRNKEGIRLSVPEHEVRVLRAMHGDINTAIICEIPQEDEVAELPLSAEAEIGRLTRRYARGEDDPVVRAFPNGPLDLERYGFVSGSKQEDAPTHGGRNHKKRPAKK